jgi:uncharacterized membrane-anchored protein
MIRPFMSILMGEEILIKTTAYDPRDVFRGDYVRIAYEISTIEMDQVDEELLMKLEDIEVREYELEGEIVYVSVVKGDRFHIVDSVSEDRPKEGTYLKGKITYPFQYDDKDRSKLTGFTVDYTLDKFFVPERTGRELEQKIIKGEAYAKVKVFRGYALITDIIAE